MKAMTAARVKAKARSLGADLCGIAQVRRFKDAPEGFRPQDIFAETKSVVMVAKRFPEGALASPGPVPYTFATHIVLEQVFNITCDLSIALQDAGVTAVPVPSEPYEHWDAKAKEGKGILSLKHAGLLAGLGVMGKNTLLTHKLFGNRIVLGALVINAILKEDPLARYSFCSDECNLCVERCPGKAIDGDAVVQKLCRENSSVTTPKGYFLYTCRTCRSVCPNGRGLREKL